MNILSATQQQINFFFNIQRTRAMSICATVFGAVSKCDIRDEECLRQHGVYTQPQPGYVHVTVSGHPQRPLYVVQDTQDQTSLTCNGAARSGGTRSLGG